MSFGKSIVNTNYKDEIDLFHLSQVKREDTGRQCFVNLSFILILDHKSQNCITIKGQAMHAKPSGNEFSTSRKDFVMQLKEISEEALG